MEVRKSIQQKPHKGVEGQTVYRSHDWLKGQVRALYISVFLALLVTACGTLGYCFIEGWSFTDALYMTVITVATVGFSEVHPLSSLGKYFTICVIVAGVGIAFFAAAALARSIVEGELKKLRGVRKMQKRIDQLKDHLIVCGYGRLAAIVVSELKEAKYNVVVIENDPQKIGMLEALGVFYVEGSADDDEVLRAAGIKSASKLLTLLSHDADNVYVTLCARDLNPNILIIARSELESGEKRLIRAGASRVIAPYRVGGTRIVQQLIRPNVMDFLEIASGKNGAQLALEEMHVPESSRVVGKTLEESALRSKTGAIIAAFVNQDGQMIFNPGRETVISGGSTMIVLGDPKTLELLSQEIL